MTTDSTIHDLARILAAGYLRLLAAQESAQDGQKPLDVAGGNEAPLAKRVSRRKKLA